MEMLRVGVIGVGHLGYHHVRLYRALEGIELVGAADISQNARDRITSDFGIPVFEDYRDLLPRVDAVSIVTPTGSHTRLACDALEKGVHVLVEKPMAATVAEGHTMLETARRSRCVLQVGHIERFNGAVMALFESGLRPMFIECHRLSPYLGRGNDVSVVLDLMIHDVDIVLELVNSEVVHLDAVGIPVFSEFEDIANVRLRFASGCVANLTSSRVSIESMRKIRIFDPGAYLSTDYSAQEVLVYRKKPGPPLLGINPMEHIHITPLLVRKEEPLKLELLAFIEAVRTGTAPMVSGEVGLRALELCDRIIQAIRTHP